MTRTSARAGAGLCWNDYVALNADHVKEARGAHAGVSGMNVAALSLGWVSNQESTFRRHLRGEFHGRGSYQRQCGTHPDQRQRANEGAFNCRWEQVSVSPGRGAHENEV